MSTIAPNSATDSMFGLEVKPRPRALTVSLAFWHVLRRDVTVTARGLIPFIIQALVMPFSFLFVFGRVLPGAGETQSNFPAIFLPGVLGVTIFMSSLQAMSLSLMLDLDGNHEIDDRLLAPLTVSLVALEKIVYAAFRSLVTAALTLGLAYLLLGPEYQVRSDSIGLMILVATLYALGSAALGLVLGSALSADKIYLLFTLIFSATTYAGCVYYSWTSIASLRFLQVIALFDPLTYASEGLRSAMVPPVNGHALATLPLGWSLLGLIVTFLGFLFLGIRQLHKRVIA